MELERARHVVGFRSYGERPDSAAGGHGLALRPAEPFGECEVGRNEVDRGVAEPEEAFAREDLFAVPGDEDVRKDAPVFIVSFGLISESDPFPENHGRRFFPGAIGVRETGLRGVDTD